MKRRIILGTILIALLAIAALLYAGRFGSTPPFRDASGAVVPGSVAEMKRVKLGGVDQFVTIRGRNRNAPILIWLHGGPGQDETGLWRLYNAALEDHFVVVYWTQRGTGRSYSSSIPVASMTLTQFVRDLHEIVGMVKAEFKQDRVVLVGHSWGTNIGVSYAQQHPENVAAYVGIGQIANSMEGERRSYAWTLAEAKRRGNAEAIAALQKMGPPPYPLESLIIQRGWLGKFGGGSFREDVPLITLMWRSFQASEMSLYDGVTFKAGNDFSQKSLASEIAGYDWIHKATKFAVPVFIIAGRYDYNADSRLAHEYFDRLEAPIKQFKWFEKSAHSPVFEEPAAFNAFIIEQVLPIAVKRQRGDGGS